MANKNFSISAILTAKDNMSPTLKAMRNTLQGFALAANMQYSLIRHAQKETGDSTTALWKKFHAENALGHLRRVRVELKLLDRALWRTFDDQILKKFEKRLHQVLSLTKTLTNTAKSAFNAITPGYGTMAAVAGAGYAGVKLVQNSSNYELLETQTAGLIDSNPAYAKIKDKNKAAKDILRKTEHYSNVNVGDYQDWAQFTNYMVGVGLMPTDRMFKMAANLSSIHKGKFPGFVESWQSGARGEITGLDQIRGLQGSTNKHNHHIELKYAGEVYDIGEKSDKNYLRKYTEAMEMISEKYFGKMSDRMGTTFDAKWSTLLSTINRTFDNAFRNDSPWFDEFVKPFVESLTQSFIDKQPYITKVFNGLYDNMKKSGLLGAIGKGVDGSITVILKSLGTFLDKLTKGDTGFSRNIKQFFDDLPKNTKKLMDTLVNADWQKILDNACSMITTLGNLASAIWKVIPSLTSMLELLGDPAAYSNKLLANKMADQYGKNDPLSQNVKDEAIAAGNMTMFHPFATKEGVLSELKKLRSGYKVQDGQIQSMMGDIPALALGIPSLDSDINTPKQNINLLLQQTNTWNPQGTVTTQNELTAKGPVKAQMTKIGKDPLRAK